MRVMGLDLSLRATGVAVMDRAGDGMDFRTWLIRQPKASNVEERTERLVHMAEKVLDIFEEQKPDLIVIEAPAKGQKYQGAAIGEIHGVIRVQLFLAFGRHPLVKESSEMRKAVIGKIERSYEVVEGKKGKKKRSITYGMVPGKRGMKRATIKDIIEQRLKERGMSFDSQDEMDAYVAARYGWDVLLPTIGCAVDDQSKEDNRRTESGMG